MFRKIILATVLTLALAPAAGAATTVVAVANVNLRAGPSTAYPAVAVVPTGAAITTFGCVAGYSWCDIGFGPYRGWVAANYIQVVYRGAPVVLAAPLAPRQLPRRAAGRRAYPPVHEGQSGQDLAAVQGRSGRRQGCASAVTDLPGGQPLRLMILS